MRKLAYFSMKMPTQVKDRLVQISRENYTTMSQMVIQMIMKWPVEHPEQIGQMTFDELNEKNK